MAPLLRAFLIDENAWIRFVTKMVIVYLRSHDSAGNDQSI